MLLMTMISFIVGLSISGQAFYTFIIERRSVCEPRRWDEASDSR
jgi:hypothetical protein